MITLFNMLALADNPGSFDDMSKSKPEHAENAHECGINWIMNAYAHRRLWVHVIEPGAAWEWPRVYRFHLNSVEKSNLCWTVSTMSIEHVINWISSARITSCEFKSVDDVWLSVLCSRAKLLTDVTDTSFIIALGCQIESHRLIYLLN